MLSLAVTLAVTLAVVLLSALRFAISSITAANFAVAIGDQNLNFHQAQLGYSFYLLGRNKETIKK